MAANAPVTHYVKPKKAKKRKPTWRPKTVLRP